jgi:hypothetical protein
MPIYIKPREQVCRERAEKDSAFYYDQFAQVLLENNNEEKSMDTQQDLLRFYKWLREYQEFAFKYHRDNFVSSDDIYLNKEDAESFGGGEKIPRAPFLPVFEEIK